MFNYRTAFCLHKNALKQRQEQSDLAQDHNSLLFKIFLLFKMLFTSNKSRNNDFTK